MSKKFVLEITPASCYRPFKAYGSLLTNYDILWTTDADSVSLLVFTGGNDVDPALYGERRGASTDYPMKKRDEHEINCFHRAKQLGIPMVGICRGAQFLCVMAGGKLVQDITGHHIYHTIRTHENKLIHANSTHHQMQLPPDNATILAYAEPKLSKHYLNGDDKKIEVPCEVEVAYYPTIKAIGIQGHPEWLEPEEPNHPFVLYSQQVVKEFLFTTK